MYINSINFGSNKTNTVNYTQKTNLTPTAKNNFLSLKKKKLAIPNTSLELHYY